jgi:hypothetical protein
MIQSLHPPDYQERVNFCNWFIREMNDDVLDQTFFSDESWFHLDGFVNSQNYRIWSGENPHATITRTLHPLKMGVWVAMSRQRIIGPYFFNFTINSDRYITRILNPFINELDDQELQHGHFQQDSATAHTAFNTMQYLRQFFGNRVISRGIWPSRSPDLTPLDFFMFGHLKNKVFARNLHTAEELQCKLPLLKKLQTSLLKC